MPPIAPESTVFAQKTAVMLRTSSAIPAANGATNGKTPYPRKPPHTSPVSPDMSSLMHIFKSQRATLLTATPADNRARVQGSDLYLAAQRSSQHALRSSATRLCVRKQFLQRHLNGAGAVFGGDLLDLLDTTATTCASRVLATSCITASAHALTFVTPVHEHELVQVDATVAATLGAAGVLVYVRAAVDERHDGSHMRLSHAGVFHVVAVAQPHDAAPRDVTILLPDDLQDTEAALVYRALAVACCAPLLHE